MCRQVSQLEEGLVTLGTAEGPFSCVSPHMSIGIFKPLDFAERNRWFGGVPGTHGDQPVTFSTYYYGLFKS